MRLLSIIVAVLALLYSGYWYLGASSVESGARTALEDLQSQGWKVAYEDLSTRGFPSRFDTTLTEARLVSPQNVVWNFPFLQAFALSYQPNRVITIFPPTLTFETLSQTFTVQSDGLRASGAVAANTALALDNVTAEVGALSLSSDLQNAISSIDSGLAALRATDDTGGYVAYLNIAALQLPPNLRAVIDPAGLHPPEVAQVTFDTGFSLDRPLDRHAMAQMAVDPPLLQDVTVTDISVNWGDMAFLAKGSVTVGQDGFPDGVIDVTAQNWRDIVAVAVTSGSLQPGLEQLVLTMGESLSEGSDTLALPLTFQDGAMSLGPIPLGPAPKLH